MDKRRLGAPGGRLAQRDRTRAEELDASVSDYRRELADVRAEVRRLEAALTRARADAERAAGYAVPSADVRGTEDMVHRLRRVVMSALHPDKAGIRPRGLADDVVPDAFPRDRSHPRRPVAERELATVLLGRAGSRGSSRPRHDCAEAIERYGTGQMPQRRAMPLELSNSTITAIITT